MNIWNVKEWTERVKALYKLFFSAACHERLLFQTETH